MTSTVPRKCSRYASSHSVARRSRWFVGSSSRRMSVSSRMSRARFTRVFSPPERRVERLRAHRGRDVQTVGDAVALVFHVVPAETAEIFRQAVVLREQGGGVVRRHARGELVHARFHIVEPPVRLAQHVLRRPAVGVDGDLRDQPQPPPGGDGHGAGVGLQLAREDAEKRRLAAAVAPEDAHALAGIDVKCDTF